MPRSDQLVSDLDGRRPGRHSVWRVRLPDPADNRIQNCRQHGASSVILEGGESEWKFVDRPLIEKRPATTQRRIRSAAYSCSRSSIARISYADTRYMF